MTVLTKANATTVSAKNQPVLLVINLTSGMRFVGQCIVVKNCDSNEDCQEGLVCKDGKCSPDDTECRDDEDCPPVILFSVALLSLHE